MFKKLPLVTKLILAIILVLVAGLGVGIVAITESSGESTDTLSLEVGQRLGQYHGALVERRLNDAMDVSRFVATSMLSMKQAGIVNRAQLNLWLKAQLEANPGVLAVWVGMEPNALDGKDAAAANTPGSDAAGRFVPYWNRGSGKVDLEPLVDFDTDGAGDYYQLPKRLMREVAIEPYTYTVAGKSTLIMSLAVPIIENGTFIGVAGVDIATDGIGDELKSVKPFDTGSVSLISNGGLWVGYANRDHLGKPIGQTNEKLKEALPAIKEGRAHSHLSFSKSLNTEVTQLFVPIQIGTTRTPWSIMVNLPMDKIEAPKVQLRNAILIGALVLTAILVLALWYSTRQIVGTPLRRIINTVQALTSGNHAVEVTDRDRGDEIGAINTALQLFKENAGRVAEMEEQRRQDEQSWSPVSGQFAKLGSALLKDDRHDGTEEAIFS